MAAETKNPVEEEEPEVEEIVVVECPWKKGKSYSVNSFKKVLPPLYQKNLPEKGKLRIKKIHPTTHRYGGYVLEAALVGNKEETFSWVQFWWTTQEKFYYSDFSKDTKCEPPARKKVTRRRKARRKKA